MRRTGAQTKGRGCAHGAVRQLVGPVVQLQMMQTLVEARQMVRRRGEASSFRIQLHQRLVQDTWASRSGHFYFNLHIKMQR